MTDESMSREIDPKANGNVLQPDFTPWLASGTRAMRGWIEANSAMLQSSVAIAEQITRFSQTRLKTDVDLWKSLSGCGSMGEFVDCQMKYAQRTTSDYLDRLKELAGCALSAVNAATLPPQE